MAVKNLLPNFWHALRTEGISRARPAERRLRLFPRLEQGLIGPLRSRRRIRRNAVEAFKNCPCAGGGNRHGLLNIFDRLVHSALAFLNSGVRTVPAVPRAGTYVNRLSTEKPACETQKFRCVEWVTVILLKPWPLSTKKAMKGRKPGLSGELGHFMG